VVEQCKDDPEGMDGRGLSLTAALHTLPSTPASKVRGIRETEVVGGHMGSGVVDTVETIGSIRKATAHRLGASVSRTGAMVQPMEGQNKCRTTPSNGGPVVVHRLYHRVLMWVMAL
jgi:hypothetical protein